MENQSVLKQVMQPPVIIAALGYFVDIYDLLLFSIVRVPSLQAIGLSGDALLKEGMNVFEQALADAVNGQEGKTAATG